MIIIGLSDIHGDAAMITAMGDILARTDVVLLVGDITHFAGVAEAGRVLKPVVKKAAKVFAVSGNCDYPEVDAYLESCAVSLHGKGVVYNGVGFVGLGGSSTTPFNTPNEMTESEIRHYLDRGRAQIPSHTPMILVSHQPPLNTGCDRLHSGKHVGSIAVRQFIEKHQPLACFTGHIHESCGIDTIDATRIINPGKLKTGRYAYADIGGKSEIFEVRKLSPTIG